MADESDVVVTVLADRQRYLWVFTGYMIHKADLSLRCSTLSLVSGRVRERITVRAVPITPKAIATRKSSPIAFAATSANKGPAPAMREAEDLSVSNSFVR
jgi:hypothetical protein